MASLQGTLFETHAIRAVYYVKVSPTHKGQSVGPNLSGLECLTSTMEIAIKIKEAFSLGK